MRYPVSKSAATYNLICTWKCYANPYACQIWWFPHLLIQGINWTGSKPDNVPLISHSEHVCHHSNCFTDFIYNRKHIYWQYKELSLQSCPVTENLQSRTTCNPCSRLYWFWLSLNDSFSWCGLLRFSKDTSLEQQHILNACTPSLTARTYCIVILLHLIIKPVSNVPMLVSSICVGMWVSLKQTLRRAWCVWS